ncbi:MAG: pilus assembly protein PilP [Candidatus Sulfobium sp.]|jgi:type IV pilus assembly protein PilP
MRRPLGILACLLLALSLAVSGGCDKAPVQSRKQVAKKAKPAPRVVAVQKQEKKQQPEVYEYEPAGRRDPFTSLIAIAKEKQQQKKSPNPMENFDVSEISLTAIVWAGDHYYALITLPNNKSYTITKGMTLGLYGGKVEKITRDSVLVREQVRDYRGRLKTKDTILRLRKEGEQ